MKKEDREDSELFFLSSLSVLTLFPYLAILFFVFITSFFFKLHVFTTILFTLFSSGCFLSAFLSCSWMSCHRREKTFFMSFLNFLFPSFISSLRKRQQSFSKASLTCLSKEKKTKSVLKEETVHSVCKRKNIMSLEAKNERLTRETCQLMIL